MNDDNCLTCKATLENNCTEVWSVKGDKQLLCHDCLDIKLALKAVSKIGGHYYELKSRDELSAILNWFVTSYMLTNMQQIENKRQDAQSKENDIWVATYEGKYEAYREIMKKLKEYL